MARWNRTVSVIAAAAGALSFGGCKPAQVHRQLSEAQLKALPSIAVTDGRQVCVATGLTGCPLGRGFANWIGSDAFALWEPGKPVMVFRPSAPAGLILGSVGSGRGQYGYALAVGESGSNTDVIDAERNVLLRFDANGQFKDERPIPPPNLNAAPGFSGGSSVIQSLIAMRRGGTATLRVRVRSESDNGPGTTVLELPVPWLHMDGVDAVGAAPMFAALPAYAITSDRGVIWCPTDSFQLQRRDAKGNVLWTVTSNWKGPEVTPAQLAARRSEVETGPAGAVPTQAVADSMVAMAPKHHAPISGILLDRNDNVLAAEASPPLQDSVAYLLFNADGTAKGRFALPVKTRVLLFAGDSVLAQRPTEGEPWEVVWLQLGKQ